MMFARRSLTVAAFLVVSVVLLASSGVTAGWPERPITVVVGFAAGGVTDLFARVVANEMARELGVNISVVNTPGASGGVAADSVLRSRRDGYTWWGMADALRGLAVMGYHRTTYQDWIPFITASFTGVISVRADSSYSSFEELLKAVRARPDTVTFSASSPGTTWHIGMEILRKYGNVNYRFVPYQGSHPSQVAAMAGEVEAVFTAVGEQAELLRSRRLRPLAVYAKEPMELPGWGTVAPITRFIAELEPYLPFTAWVGLFVPLGVPEEVVESVTRAYAKAVQSPAVVEFARTNYGALLGLTGDKAVEWVERDTRRVSWLLWDLGIAKHSPEAFGIARP